MRNGTGTQIGRIGAAFVCLALVGCGPTSSGGGGQGGGNAPEVKLSAADMADFFKTKVTGKPGGRFTDATIADPKTFNIVIANETSSSVPLGFVFDALVGRNSE